MKIARILAIAVICIISTLNISAQKKGDRSAERMQWEAEMTQYRNDVFTKELNLSADQKTQFLALYDAMDRERRGLMHKMRKARKELRKKANPTDADYLEVVDLENRSEGQIKSLEAKYYAEYRKVLTPKQMFMLREVEHQYMGNLRKHISGKKK